MKQKKDVQQGTLALMVLKTLDVLGPLHGYGIARSIEQIRGDLLSVNQGTLYPVLLRLEQEGAITSEWGPRKTTAGDVVLTNPERPCLDQTLKVFHENGWPTVPAPASVRSGRAPSRDVSNWISMNILMLDEHNRGSKAGRKTDDGSIALTRLRSSPDCIRSGISSLERLDREELPPEMR